MIARRVVFMLVVAVAGCDKASDAPLPIPPAGADSAGALFQIALWPGEGIPVIHAVTTRLTLRESPSGNAAVRTEMQIDTGSVVHYDSTQYKTAAVGHIEVLAPTRVTGRDLGVVRELSRDAYQSTTFPGAAYDVVPPERIEFLQHRAENTCFVRVRQHVINADPCPASDTATFRVVSPPVVEWWIHVNDAARGTGWLLLVDGVAKVVRRTF
jgi:hypothetical protein